ncbi:TatD family hydrolase [Alteromonas sp. C1M14]|uniref:TatD family hydrolase n=1 Tax=Alteromonas sp. C1M14 TaxID=2841567 RepID=UPI001C091544|nr:TatD family hydrolase [Alteromonas sp. C1M14]MBU2979077.1 TatD family hydrolase [Alteromonas sp. C1M14]
MIDSHCHLDFAVFDTDRGEVISRANECGVNAFLIPGTTAEGWDKQRDIKTRYDNIYLAFGWHPWFLPDDIQTGCRQLEQAIGVYSDKIIAVGEVGLDATLPMPMAQQETWLSEQLRLAQQANLPVILHHRKTHHRLPAVIKDSGFTCGGVVHGFSGSPEVAQAYLELGFKLGIGGTITYPRGKKTLATIKAMGLSSILLETDAPDMPMMGFQGQRNEPAHLVGVVQILQGLFEESAEHISHVTDATFRDTFSLA